MKLFILFLILSSSFTLASERLALIGQIPNQYLDKSEQTQTSLGIILLKDKIIEDIVALKGKDDLEKRVNFLKEKSVPFIELKTDEKYDILYPGLIDLHGHNKQNMLGTWKKARGQFANRFEWRKEVTNYEQVQSYNMNPWSSGKMAQVAAYRWSELQAMVLGTTYLQGYILNHKNFSIHSIEDRNAYISERKTISSSGDIIEPARASFLWTDLRSVIQELGCLGEDKCYGKAVAKFFTEHCSNLPEVVVTNIYTKESYNWMLENKEILDQQCEVENKEAFMVYFSDFFGVDQHKSFITKYNNLQGPKRSALITHIAEGRRLDPYNRTEFQLLELGGLAIPGVNIIHGVGLRDRDFKTMAKNQMGLIWSPYSNFLLYGETVNLKAAKEAGVLLALGSDWTPTGSKGVLEELKMAYKFLVKNQLDDLVTIQDLYDMVTKNPARMINHYGYESEKERGIGTLQKGAMATVIAVRAQSSNPFENLVLKAQAQDINLVVIDGKPIYGNESYLSAWKSKEKISNLVFKTSEDNLPKDKIDEESLGKIASGIELADSQGCQFKETKYFIQHGPSSDLKKIATYKEKTGLDLETFAGIQRYLGVALLSQSHNALGKGSKKYAVREFPPLYGCDDPAYAKRLNDMVKISGEDEYDENQELRASFRVEMRLFSSDKKKTLPHELAELYQFDFEIRTNYVELPERDGGEYQTEVVLSN